MPDISKLVVAVESNGVVTASANMDAFTRSMRLSEQESAKLEKATGRYTESINSMNSVLRDLDQQLLKTKKEQDNLANSIMKLMQTNGAAAEIQKLAAQFNNLDNEIKKIQNEKALTGILKEYETGYKRVTIETSLFGESLSTLKQKQDLAKTALVQMIEAGVSPAEREVGILRRQYSDLTDQIEITQRKQHDMAERFAAFHLIANKLPGPLRSIASGLMGLVSPATAAVSAFLELGEAAVNLVKESVRAFGDYELIKTNLEMVMGSAKAANTTFRELRELAAKTPFSLPDVAQAASMLRQAGVEADNLVETITMLGNVSGGSMERFNRIAYNYTQALQKGVLDSRDQRDFATSLVPINDALRAIGVTGKATSDDMIRAFQYMTREGGMFFDAINRQGETLVGKTEQLKEAWQSLLATIADKTGIGNAVKDVTGAFGSLLTEIDNMLNSKSALAEAISAVSLGTATTEQTLTVLKHRIIEVSEEYDRLSDARKGGAGGVEADRQYFYISEMLNNLRQQYDLYIGIFEQEKTRTSELGKQKKLLDDQKNAYNGIVSAVEERYSNSQEGKLRALVAERDKILEAFETFKRGRTEEYQSDTPEFKIIEDFSGYDFSIPDPSQGPRTFTRTRQIMPTDEELHEWEVAIEGVNSDIEELSKKLNPDPLKDWQTELGKIFNFTPTSATRGDSTVKKYIDDLAEARNKLFAAYGDETIADLLGIDELEYAKNELAGMQSSLREMLEFKGSETWTVENDESAARLAGEIEAGEGRVEGLAFDKYLSDLDREYKLLQMSNEEREEAKFLDDLLKDGIKDRAKIEELLEARRRNIARDKENEYKKTYDDMIKELGLRKELAGLSEKEARIRELTVKFGGGLEGEARARTVYDEEQAVKAGEAGNARAKSLKDLEAEVGLKRKTLWLSEEEARVQELIADKYDENTARLQAAAEEAKKNLDAMRAVIESLNRPDSGADDIMAGILGTSELDRAKAELSELEGQLRQLAEFRGTASWTQDAEDAFNKIKAKYDEAAESVKGLTEKGKYDEYLKALNQEYEFLGMSNKERERAVYLNNLIKAGVEDPDLQQDLMGKWDRNYSAKETEKYNKSYEEMKKELELRKESVWLSEEEKRVRELTAQFGGGPEAEARAREIYELEREIQKAEALKDAFVSLKDAAINLGASSLVDFARDMGKAFQDGSVSTDEFSDSIRNMMRNIIDAMPQLLLNVGLQLISKGAWQAGLAFIGASGLMSFVSGLISDEEDSGRNDELERLNKIQQQITDLLAAQREQEEYYTAKKRQLNARASMSVNDAIITPKGVINTHPEDYIVAMRHPETLMSGGAAPVNITVINNTPDSVTAQDEGVGGDGARRITVLVDRIVQNGLSGGRYDGALDSMNRRRGGRRVYQ